MCIYTDQFTSLSMWWLVLQSIPHASQLTHAHWLHPIPLSHWCAGDPLIPHKDVPSITGESNLSVDCSTRSRHVNMWKK